MFGWFLRRIRRSRNAKGVKFIIDGENLRESLKDLDRDEGDVLEVIDNSKKLLDKGEKIKGVYFYNTLWPGNQKQAALKKRLKKNKVKVILKPEKAIINKMAKKSRIDPWIGVEIMETVIRRNERDIKKIFLFSGDSDFEAPLKAVKERGIELIVITSRNALSKELAAVANRTVNLKKLLDASQ